MASNYTSSYNLNQWSASDRVLRTDFKQLHQQLQLKPVVGVGPGTSDGIQRGQRENRRGSSGESVRVVGEQSANHGKRSQDQ